MRGDDQDASEKAFGGSVAVALEGAEIPWTGKSALKQVSLFAEKSLSRVVG